MRLRIECTVPDEWRDQDSTAGILRGPYDDITESLLSLGAEDIDTEEIADTTS